MMHDPVKEVFARICERMRFLTETQLKVLLHVTRQTLDANGEAVAISIRDMTQSTGLSNRGAIAAVQALADQGLLNPQPQRDVRGGHRPTCYALPFVKRSAPNSQASAQRAQGREQHMPSAGRRGMGMLSLVEKQARAALAEDAQGSPWLHVPLPEHFYVKPKTWEFCLRNVCRREPTLITGPTGCGKTELVTYLAQATGRQLYPVNMGATTDPRAVLVGTTHFGNGQTTFYESRFIEGLQDPRGLILLDEITRANDEANNMLFPILDGQQYLSLDEAHPPRIVEKHPSVVFFATANMGQEYTGTRELDRALKDRFCIVELEYPPRQAEAEVLTARTRIARQHANNLVAFAHTCRAQWRREELSTPVSARMLVKVAAAVMDDFSMGEALEFFVLPYFDATGGADSERARVRQILLRF